MVLRSQRMWEAVGRDSLGAHILAEMGVRLRDRGTNAGDRLAERIGNAMIAESRRYYSKGDEPEELVAVFGLTSEDPELHRVEEKPSKVKKESTRAYTLCGQQVRFNAQTALVRLSHALRFATACLTCADEEIRRAQEKVPPVTRSPRTGALVTPDGPSGNGDEAT